MYFGAHGLKSQNVQIAPEDTHLLPDSKRKILISQEDSDLDKNLNVLDIGTKSRNRAFQDRLVRKQCIFELYQLIELFLA